MVCSRRKPVYIWQKESLVLKVYYDRLKKKDAIGTNKHPQNDIRPNDEKHYTNLNTGK